MIYQNRLFKLKVKFSAKLIEHKLLLENSRPMGEVILKRAVTIVMQRQMNTMPEIENISEEHVTKPFDVYMQELEERHERRMREKKEKG